jgi:hypothetical protein
LLEVIKSGITGVFAEPTEHCQVVLTIQRQTLHFH